MHQNGRVDLSMNLPSLPTTLTDVIIDRALLASRDHGETLDFSHHNLANISEEEANQLASASQQDVHEHSLISRIAMSYNRLISLPMAFSQLSRLRYLNLRSNLFHSFPNVLTALPSLEILDLSRNNILSLPEHPGMLTNLQILSISRNKISTLPPYLSTFHHLDVLKFDHNPIKWPPANVMDFLLDRDDRERDQNIDWLTGLKTWLEEHENETPKTTNYFQDSHIVPQYGVSRANGVGRQGLTFPDTSYASHSRGSSFDSINVGSPYPTDLVHALGFNTDGTAAAQTLLSQEASNDDWESQVSPTSQHLRNASFSIGDHSPKTSRLSAKKSLPDLRTVRRPPVSHEEQSTVELRETSASVDGLSPLRAGKLNFRRRHFNEDLDAENSDAGVMAAERNSYFKRLSACPVTSSSMKLPALQETMDAIRGIYFAVHQVFEQVDHYTLWTTDDRISGVLRKVLEPSRSYTSQLTAALEQYDVVMLSGGSSPPAIICRSVVESCRDAIAVCGKVIGALQLQLKVLAGSDDVRFTRSLLLMLYGSMAEISNSWQVIVQHSPSLRPLLHERRESTASTGTTLQANGTQSRNGSGLAREGRTRNTRRHAGSFSYRDVEIGKSMSSPLVSEANPPSQSNFTFVDDGFSRIAKSSIGQPSHVRNNPPALGSSSDVSPSAPLPPRAPPVQNRPATGRLDPIHSSQLMDRELVDTISTTVQNAFILWHMLEDVLSQSLQLEIGLRSTLENAIQNTDHMVEIVSGLQTGIEGGISSKMVFDDTVQFVKVITQVSVELRHFGSIHPLPSQIRNMIAQVTQSTKDTAILLHVSSFSRSASETPTPGIVEETSTILTGNATGLSRSRSAQPPGSSKPVSTFARDIPQSAQYRQRFPLSPTELVDRVSPNDLTRQD